nr:hypothetical protein [Streptomyces sabulosicollis]
MSAPREPHLPPDQAPWVEERGDKLRITAVRAFLTAPQGCPHLIVRVETSDIAASDTSASSARCSGRRPAPGRRGAACPFRPLGLGADFDESAARRYPAPGPLGHDRWALPPTTDGSVQRP